MRRNGKSLVNANTPKNRLAWASAQAVQQRGLTKVGLVGGGPFL